MSPPCPPFLPFPLPFPLHTFSPEPFVDTCTFDMAAAKSPHLYWIGPLEGLPEVHVFVCICLYTLVVQAHTCSWAKPPPLLDTYAWAAKWRSLGLNQISRNLPESKKNERIWQVYDTGAWWYSAQCAKECATCIYTLPARKCMGVYKTSPLWCPSICASISHLFIHGDDSDN